ncbi:MAG: zinc ribbon domain-containing protein [Micrococcaceae bacterium]
MALTATLEEQQRLLELQQLDSDTDAARAQMTRLRADEQLAELRARVTALETEDAEHARTADSARTELTAAEDRAAKTQARRDQTRSRLDAGQGGAKELQNMGHELETLEALLQEHEETQLGAMETAETAEDALTTARASLETARDQASEREQTVTEELHQVAARGKALLQQRAELAESLPEALASAYDRARERNGGIGAARLEGNVSGASGMALSPVELDAIQALDPTEVARCPETDALLIRS